MLKPQLLIIILLIGVLLYFLMNNSEKFSTSGMTFSDKYCTKLANVYLHPKMTDERCRNMYGEKLCGMKRRNTIDMRTGNYYTDGGVLV